MKKLFIVLAIASLGFVACNNESKTEVKEDTTSTVAPVPAPADTTTAPAVADTTAKPDTTKK